MGNRYDNDERMMCTNERYCALYGSLLLFLLPNIYPCNIQYVYFQNSRCTKLSAVIHELGHSVLGFMHSSKGTTVYGDVSCYMGFTDNTVAFPRKAFVS
jgi:hypothetical protein